MTFYWSIDSVPAQLDRVVPELTMNADVRADVRIAALDLLFNQYLLDPTALAARFRSEFSAESPHFLKPDETVPLNFIAEAIISINRAVREQRELSLHDTSILYSYGVERADLGISLDAILRGWQVAVKIAMQRIVDGGRSAGIDSDVLMELARDLFTVTDSAIIEICRGHGDARDRKRNLILVQRNEFVNRLLMPGQDAKVVIAECEDYGLDVDRHYHPFQIYLQDRSQLVTLMSKLDRLDTFQAPDGILAYGNEGIIGVCSKVPDVTFEGVLGIGDRSPLDTVSVAMERAVRSACAGIAFGRRGVQIFSSMGLLPAVFADSATSETLFEKYITPIGTGEAAEILLSTVSLYLNLNMSVEDTSGEMHVHQNTIRYRISRFEKLTSSTLRSPQTISEVWWALAARTLADKSV